MFGPSPFPPRGRLRLARQCRGHDHRLRVRSRADFSSTRRDSAARTPQRDLAEPADSVRSLACRAAQEATACSQARRVTSCPAIRCSERPPAGAAERKRQPSPGWVSCRMIPSMAVANAVRFAIESLAAHCWPRYASANAALRHEREFGKPIEIGADVRVGAGALILAGANRVALRDRRRERGDAGHSG